MTDNLDEYPRYTVTRGPRREMLFDAIRLTGEHRKLRFTTAGGGSFDSDTLGVIEVYAFGIFHTGGNTFMIYAGEVGRNSDLLFRFNTESRFGHVWDMGTEYWKKHPLFF